MNSPHRATSEVQNSHTATAPNSLPESSNRFWPTCLFVLFCVALTALILSVSSSRIVRAEFALGHGDFPRALTLASQELSVDPQSDRALLVAGSASMAMSDMPSAQLFFSRVSFADAQLLAVSQTKLAQLALGRFSIAEADDRLRAALSLVPDNADAANLLIYVLMLQSRNWDAQELAYQQIQRGIAASNYLYIVGTNRSSIGTAEDFSKQCLQARPDDPLPRLFLAKKAWRENQIDEARQHLKFVLGGYPELIEAHALWLRILAESGTREEFVKALSQLPPNAETHPEIWTAKGLWSENQDQMKAAARCYAEALQRDPNRADASYRLSQVLVKLNQPDLAAPWGNRAERLTTLTILMYDFSSRVHFELLPSVIELLQALGRDWEAAGWCQVILREQNQDAAWASSVIDHLYSRMIANTASSTNISSDIARLDRLNFPLPEFDPKTPSSKTPEPKITATRRGLIRFEDEAERLGIRFRYLNGAPGGDAESLLEMDGGGVAVLDFDCDFWPDIFLTQGGVLPPGQFDPLINDRLFLNRGQSALSGTGPVFEDVTVSTGIVDRGYGQGVTVGDFDNDGFPDLYVCNIGQNQFLRNNGDGTFTDMTDVTNTALNVWTSSGVIADLNNDGFPDLYAVTYLAGTNAYKICKKRSTDRCGPLRSPAEPDRFFLSSGDGHFQDLSNQHGLDASEGRGLGILAADFDGSRRLSLYVANDMSANFFFHNQTANPRQLAFHEEGLLFGLALNYKGAATASMGIAAGDYNRDGRLDMFVTNFYREPKEFYVQQPDGSFIDKCRETRLYDPGFLKTGWGTQFLDADLDGYSDLIATNGHVHEPTEDNAPYQMESQFFLNRGGVEFELLDSSELGPFFAKKLLGRSLARIDWNQDGLEEACISHLDHNVTLLTNKSSNPGHFLALRLVAVDSARDAIGATVQLRIGNESWVSQLTAGDGFQASNERRLVIGTGENKIADTIEVNWPSGMRQQFQHVELDREWILVEQRPLLQLSHRSHR